jgi:hypothetical protein
MKSARLPDVLRRQFEGESLFESKLPAEPPILTQGRPRRQHLGAYSHAYIPGLDLGAGGLAPALVGSLPARRETGPVFTMMDVAQMNRIGSIGIVICRIFGPPAHGLKQLNAFEKEINDMWTRIPDGSGHPMSVFLSREAE